MVAAVKTALPTVNDPSSSMQLSNSSKQFSQALTDLRTSVTKARDSCGPLELDSALDMLYALREELDAFSRAVDAYELKPLPGETAEGTAQQLSATSKAVGSNMAQLMTAVSQGDEKYTGMAARSTAVALQDFTDAVRGVAATSDQPAEQHKIIDGAKDVVTQVHSNWFALVLGGVIIFTLFNRQSTWWRKPDPQPAILKILLINNV